MVCTGFAAANMYTFTKSYGKMSLAFTLAESFYQNAKFLQYPCELQYSMVFGFRKGTFAYSVYLVLSVVKHNKASGHQLFKIKEKLFGKCK